MGFSVQRRRWLAYTSNGEPFRGRARQSDDVHAQLVTCVANKWFRKKLVPVREMTGRFRLNWWWFSGSFERFERCSNCGWYVHWWRLRSVSCSATAEDETVRSEVGDAGRGRPDDDAVGSNSYSRDCSSDDDSSGRTLRQNMAEMGRAIGDWVARSEIWMQSDWRTVDDSPNAITAAANRDDAERPLRLPIDWASAADEWLPVDSMNCADHAVALDEQAAGGESGSLVAVRPAAAAFAEGPKGPDSGG